MSKLLVFFRNLFTREVFKPIEDYEGLYEISNFGKVKSFHCGKERVLKCGIKGSDYYYMVALNKNGREKTFYVHQLVWDHFGDKPRNGRVLQIDHLDENKQNNWIANLQLLSQRENVSKGHLQNGKKSSRHTGVSWYKITKKWNVQIQRNKKIKHLGYFKDEYEAHLVYQRALKKK